MRKIDIAKKIKAAEAYAGMNDTKLTEAIGTSSSAFTQRKKTGKFSMEELERIASAMGCEFRCEFVFPDGTKI